MKFNKLHDWGLCCLLLILFIVICISVPIDMGLLTAVLVASITICSITNYIMDKVDKSKQSKFMMLYAIGGSILLWFILVVYVIIKFTLGGTS